MRSLVVVALASLLIAGELVACSSSDSDGGGGTGGTSTSSGTGGAGPSSASSTTGSVSASAGGAGGAGDACAMLATYDACDECECTKYSAGCDKYVEIEDDKCFCGTGAPCSSACTAYCGGGAYAGTCEACWNGLRDDDPCVEATIMACDADPDCKEYSAASDAACLDKP